MISDNDLEEISDLAIWTTSSNKPGFPTSNMRDGSEETFWQSDCQTPHFVDLIFPYLVPIQMVGLYLDYELDDSFTPEKILIQSGVSDTEYIVQFYSFL
ncbi:Anaphase-promoting complex subunit 10 [Smittium culicis]|uniref:Anaphase-promoting complex subunit 10 n=1 Tax=Smittium culicis TaxID=133412 RepID=A0A1R1XGJ0_9FUNG|nr:Anaphase-promoting complex subunit 10 [Smittium culicis]